MHIYVAFVELRIQLSTRIARHDVSEVPTFKRFSTVELFDKYNAFPLISITGTTCVINRRFTNVMEPGGKVHMYSAFGLGLVFCTF